MNNSRSNYEFQNLKTESHYSIIGIIAHHFSPEIKCDWTIPKKGWKMYQYSLIIIKDFLYKKSLCNDSLLTRWISLDFFCQIKILKLESGLNGWVIFSSYRISLLVWVRFFCKSFDRISPF